jgi:hypothetical protein
MLLWLLPWPQPQTTLSTFPISTSNSASSAVLFHSSHHDLLRPAVLCFTFPPSWFSFLSFFFRTQVESRPVVGTTNPIFVDTPTTIIEQRKQRVLPPTVEDFTRSNRAISIQLHLRAYASDSRAP